MNCKPVVVTDKLHDEKSFCLKNNVAEQCQKDFKRFEAELVKGKLLVVKVEIEEQTSCLVNVYAPNQGTERLGF